MDGLIDYEYIIKAIDQTCLVINISTIRSLPRSAAIFSAVFPDESLALMSSCSSATNILATHSSSAMTACFQGRYNYFILF